MKALVWHGKEDIRCDTVSDPAIEDPRDAIVKVTSCAICGSDLHLFHNFIPAMLPGDIMGHEMMGEVVEVGSAMNGHLRKGDRVVVLQGKDRGKEGVVMRSLPSKGKVIVEGVNIAKKHQKPTQKVRQGGIIEREGALALSSALLGRIATLGGLAPLAGTKAIAWLIVHGFWRALSSLA